MFCGSNRMIQTNQFSLIVNQSACWLCAHHYPPRLSLFSLETSRVQLLPCPRRAAHRRRRSTGRTAWVFSVELLFCLSRPRHILDAESCPKFLNPHCVGTWCYFYLSWLDTWRLYHMGRRIPCKPASGMEPITIYHHLQKNLNVYKCVQLYNYRPNQ